MSTAARPPGRPRSLRVDEAIIDAVLDILAEGTAVDALSIEAVASRAGVGKAAIYRRWPHKDALVLDAVASLKGPIPDLPGRSVREDLILIAGVIAASHGTRAAEVMPCLMPELQRNSPLRDAYLALMERRRDVTRSVVRRGIVTGELKPDTDVELVVAMISGPMMMSTLGSAPRLSSEKLAERLVGALLAGIAR